jgi:hypothetical protein
MEEIFESKCFLQLLFSFSGFADVALISIRTDNSDGFEDRFACLPEKEDDPVSECFEVAYPTGNGTRLQNNLRTGNAPPTY